MAVTVNVPGLASIVVCPAAGTPLYALGYTQNGAMITFEGYELRVPGDENGGDDGPPVEIQYLGQTARVRLELTKFDTTIADLVIPRFSGGTLGQPVASASPVGSLLFAGSGFFRLIINSPTRPYNFPCVSLLRAPQEINVGTKYQRHILEAECYKHPTTGVLFNRTVT
jgi:hypothetical protein